MIFPTMKNVYLQPLTEVVKLAVSHDIAEGDFVINSKESEETLGKKNQFFEEEGGATMTGGNSNSSLWGD